MFKFVGGAGGRMVKAALVATLFVYPASVAIACTVRLEVMRKGAAYCEPFEHVPAELATGAVPFVV